MFFVFEYIHSYGLQASIKRCNIDGLAIGLKSKSFLSIYKMHGSIVVFLLRKLYFWTVFPRTIFDSNRSNNCVKTLIKKRKFFTIGFCHRFVGRSFNRRSILVFFLFNFVKTNVAENFLPPSLRRHVICRSR